MNSNYREINRNYTVWLDTLGFSSSVIYDYKHRVSDFLEWLDIQGISQINQLTQKHLTSYFNHLETRPNKRRKGTLLSVSHLNHNFSAIDKLLEFLNTQGLQNVPLPTGYRMHVDQGARIRKIEPFTPQEIKTLIQAIPQSYLDMVFEYREQKHYQLKLIFALYYGCGLRLSEGAKLRLQDIDFERKTIFVKQGKNYKDRFIPMSAGVYRDLQDYIYNFRTLKKRAHNRLFLNSNGELNKMLKHLQSVCKDEQIQQKRLSMHVLRHSIATHLLQNGMSIENISQFLGHSSLESTQIYTHVVEQNQ
ncbi:MAG: hypothetical protein RL494_317 [Bacteroidota bacterium]|jgi:integrase/recombinase XerD